MAAFVLMVLLLAMATHSSATWCICKGGISDAALQKTLDYACGAGADCNPSRQNGPCFNPNTVRAHCNYAVNSYFQRNRQAPTACDFSGTAAVVTSDPSTAGCAYPATASATAGPVTMTPTTPITGTPTTTMPNGGPPTTAMPNGGGSPLVTTPSTGVLGGPNNGLTPSGINNGINNDMSDGTVLVPTRILFYLSIILTISGLRRA